MTPDPPRTKLRLSDQPPVGRLADTWAECHETVAGLMADPEWLAQMRDNVRECPEQAERALRFMGHLGLMMRRAARHPGLPGRLRAKLLQSAADCAEAETLIRSAGLEDA
jgi:hypothetical protein